MTGDFFYLLGDGLVPCELAFLCDVAQIDNLEQNVRFRPAKDSPFTSDQVDIRLVFVSIPGAPMPPMTGFIPPPENIGGCC